MSYPEVIDAHVEALSTLGDREDFLKRQVQARVKCRSWEYSPLPQEYKPKSGILPLMNPRNGSGSGQTIEHLRGLVKFMIQKDVEKGRYELRGRVEKFVLQEAQGDAIRRSKIPLGAASAQFKEQQIHRAQESAAALQSSTETPDEMRSLVDEFEGRCFVDEEAEATFKIVGIVFRDRVGWCPGV